MAQSPSRGEKFDGGRKKAPYAPIERALGAYFSSRTHFKNISIDGGAIVRWVLNLRAEDLQNEEKESERKTLDENRCFPSRLSFYH